MSYNNCVEIRTLEIVSKHIPGNELNNININLQDIGVDSIIFIKIIIDIELEFGFEFDDEDLIIEKFQSVKDLIKYINERSQVST